MGASSQECLNMHAHGASASAEAAGASRRRKYAETAGAAASAGESERGGGAGESDERRCERGPLARAEAAVCVCAAGAAGARAGWTFGSDAVGTDLATVAMLVTLCGLAEGVVRRSPLYRSGADPGVLAGCTAVPVLVVALMLRAPAGSSAADLEATRFFLRLAVSCSSMALGEAVFGDGRWGGSGTRWRDELRPAATLVLLGLTAAGRHPFVAWPVPLAALALALIFMRALLRCTPGSFTLGEAALISTGGTLLAVDWAAMLISNAGRWRNVPLAREMLPVDIAVHSLLVGTMIVVAVMWPFVRPPERAPERTSGNSRSGNGAAAEGWGSCVGSLFYPDRASKFGLCLACAVGFLCIPPPSLLLGKHFFLWVGEHVLQTSERLWLLGFWMAVFVSVVAYMAVVFPGQRRTLPKTVVRKSYHVLALLLFVPGQLLQPETMRLAYAAAFALLCTLELVRNAHLGPLSDLLQRFIDEHKDERDGGVVVLTHIYLLLGCALPSFLCPHATKDVKGAMSILLSVSGVLIVGVGDTAASVYGKLRGRHRWHKKAGGKTVEGTVAGAICSIAAAFLTVHVSIRLGAHAEWGQWWLPAACAVGVATGAAALLEAFTQQIDNLVLPVWFFILLSTATGV